MDYSALEGNRVLWFSHSIQLAAAALTLTKPSTCTQTEKYHILKKCFISHRCLEPSDLIISLRRNSKVSLDITNTPQKTSNFRTNQSRKL